MAVAQYPFAAAPFAASIVESPNAAVDVTGQEATGAVGTVSLVTDQILAQTGVEGTG